MTYTLYRVVEVTCSPIPGVRLEALWTHDYCTCPDATDVDYAAEKIIAVMDDYPTMNQVEWDQDGEHYLLRRAHES